MAGYYLAYGGISTVHAGTWKPGRNQKILHACTCVNLSTYFLAQRTWMDCELEFRASLALIPPHWSFNTWYVDRMGVMEIRMRALVCSAEQSLGTNTCALFSVDTTVQTQICEYYMREVKKSPVSPLLVKQQIWYTFKQRKYSLVHYTWWYTFSRQKAEHAKWECLGYVRTFRPPLGKSCPPKSVLRVAEC